MLLCSQHALGLVSRNKRSRRSRPTQSQVKDINLVKHIRYLKKVRTLIVHLSLIRSESLLHTEGRTNWSDRVYAYANLLPTRYMNFRSRNVKLYVESTSSNDTVPIRDVQRFVRTGKGRGIATKFVQDSTGLTGGKFTRRRISGPTIKWTKKLGIKHAEKRRFKNVFY